MVSNVEMTVVVVVIAAAAVFIALNKLLYRGTAH